MKNPATIFLIATLGFLSVGCDSTHGATKEESDQRIDPRNPYVAKLDSIVISKVDMEDTPIEEALNFVRQRIVELAPELDTRPKGISLPPTRRPSVESKSYEVVDAASGHPLSSGEAPRIPLLTFKAKNIKVLDVLAEIAKRTKLDAYITSQGIIFVPEGAMPVAGKKNIEIWHVIRKTDVPTSGVNKANKP